VPVPSLSWESDHFAKISIKSGRNAFVCFLSPVEQLDGVLIKEWIARVIELAQAEARQKRPRHGVVEGFLRHLPCFDCVGDVVEHVISCGNGNENENGGSFV